MMWEWAARLGIVLSLTVLAYKSRVVTKGAAFIGALIALLYASATSWAPLALFILFVFLGSWSSRLGLEKKRAQGVAQSNGGRRGILHACANCIVGALFLAAAHLDLLAMPIAELAACGSLAAMLADTVASEWGTWLGGTPRDILTWQPVAVGADGGVTLAGFISSTAAACVCGALSALILGSSSVFWCVSLAGVAGNVADSLMGSSLEPKLGRSGGSIVNFLASIVGALATLIY